MLIKIALFWLLIDLNISAPDAQTPAKPPIALRRVALIVTNDDPKYMKPIPSAWRDGLGMEDRLKSMHYEIISLSNASHKRISHVLDSLEKHTQDIGTLVMYFSVHALSVNNMDFFLASDADTLGNIRWTSFSLYGTLAKLQTHNKNLCIVVFYDACRLECAGLREQFQKWGKLKYPDLSNVFIFYASYPDKEALGYKTSLFNSIFTGALIEHICDPFTLYMICTVVIREVRKTSVKTFGLEHEQVPVVEIHIDHDLYLDPTENKAGNNISEGNTVLKNIDEDSLLMDGPVVSIVGPRLKKLHHHENENPAVPIIPMPTYTGSIS